MKTNLLFTILLSFVFTNSAFPQWESLGLSTSQFENIWDIESHNGILFASDNTDGFQKSTDNGDTWTAVNQTGFTTNPISIRAEIIKSAGSNLYVVTFNANYASSMVYKSTDDGQTFTPDTVGLPKVNTGNNECVNIDRFYYNNGYLIADVANLGNWIKGPSGNWVKTTSALAEYAELFGFYGSNTFAWGNYQLVVSADNGQSWTAATNADLPSFFTANLLVVNETSGRIYAAGTDVVNQDYRLLYSDDNGASWDSLAIHQYLGTNWLSGLQTIQRMYANGSMIEIALDNNMNFSSPDVLSSADGGVTFAPDITGLPTDAGQTVTARKFTTHNNYLFMALNYRDGYKKQLTVSVAENNGKQPVNVFPNPFENNVTITNAAKNSDILVYGIDGRFVMAGSLNASNELNLSALVPGVYYLQFSDVDGAQNIHKIVKY